MSPLTEIVTLPFHFIQNKHLQHKIYAIQIETVEDVEKKLVSSSAAMPLSFPMVFFQQNAVQTNTPSKMTYVPS